MYVQTPQSDAGKIAVALYAIVSIYAVGILLDPGKQYLEGLCRPRAKQNKASKLIDAKKKDSTKED